MNWNFIARSFACLLLGALALMSITAHAEDDEQFISCVIDKDTSNLPIQDLASDITQMALFEGIRNKGGGKWSQEAWLKRFPAFRDEWNSILKPIQADAVSLQLETLRTALKEKFSNDELSQICEIMKDSYFAKFQEKSTASAKAVNAYLQARTSGRPISDSKMREILARAREAERDMHAFIAENREQISKISSTPAFARWLRTTDDIRKKTSLKLAKTIRENDDVKSFQAKWEALADAGEQ
jgi:hypothetical protein